MKKFEFKLQRILDIREKLEQEQKNVLTKVASEYQSLLLRKQDSEQLIADTRQKIFSQMREKKLSIMELKRVDVVQMQGMSIMREIEGKIEEKRKIMERERDKYSQLVKDRKSIEILKEKAQKKHKLQEQKHEMMMIDEIFNARRHSDQEV